MCPTVGRKRLGVELRRLRMAQSLRLDDVAVKLGIGASTVSRAETGKTSMSRMYLAAVLDLYGVNDPAQRELLMLMRQEGSSKEWWGDYAPVLPAGAGRYLGLEAAATRVCVFSALRVPGAIQTRRYTVAACLASRPGADSGMAETVAALQWRRQERLRHDGVKLRLIVDESALLRFVGSAQVMTEQLEHLQTAADSASVSVRVSRLAAAGAALCSSFGLLTLSDQTSPGIACCEGIGGQVFIIERPDDVTTATATFEALERTAESKTRSAALIEKAAALWQRRAAEGS